MRLRGFVSRSLLLTLAACVGLGMCATLVQAQQAPDTRSQRAEQKAIEEAQAAQEARAKAEAEARERARAAVFEKLAKAGAALRTEEAQLEKKRETEFQKALQDQERATQEQVKRRDAAEARGKELDREWNANDKHLKEIKALLAQNEGNLGELFGVTRQVAGDAAGLLERSQLSTQYNPAPGAEERSEFMRRLAGAKELPSIAELRRLSYELLREMTGQGQVVRYPATVMQPEHTATTAGMKKEQQQVVRVGPFTAVDKDGQYLGYLPGERAFTTLDGTLPGYYLAIARNLVKAQPGGGADYVRAVEDPSRGALLNLYLERPSWFQRIEYGATVGYVIITVGVIGLLLALFQYGYLIKTTVAVKSQLRDLRAPKANNPLGRLLLAFGHDAAAHESPDVAELRLSEAVLREVPKLERFQAFLRLAISAGPLLGLIGTVIGMIITFHAIVASGASDPRIMAHGIGQAMIATVLGLGVAIPLLFINAGLVGFSRNITQLLDEHSQRLLGAVITRGQGHHATPKGA